MDFKKSGKGNEKVFKLTKKNNGKGELFMRC